MPVPKKRKTKSQQGNRRSHIKVEESELSECPNCGETIRPHTVCSNCGYYKGEQVIKSETESEESTQSEKTSQSEEEKEKGLSWKGLSRN